MIILDYLNGLLENGVQIKHIRKFILILCVLSGLWILFHSNGLRDILATGVTKLQTTSPRSQSYTISIGSSSKYNKSGYNYRKTMSDDITIHNENMNKLESMSGDIEVYDSTFNMAKSMSGDITVQNSEGGLVATMSGNLKLRGSNINTVWMQSGEGTITSCNIDVLHMYNDTMYMNDSTVNVIKTDCKYFVIPKGNKVNIVVFEYGGQVEVEDGYPIRVVNGKQVQ